MTVEVPARPPPWAPVGLVMGWEYYHNGGLRWDLIGVPRPFSLLVDTLLRFTREWALVGAFTGACFASILAIAERRHAFGEFAVDTLIHMPSDVIEALIPDSLIPRVVALPNVEFVRATPWRCAAEP